MEFGQGFSIDNLQRMRMFCITYQKYATESPNSQTEIWQTLSVKSPADKKTQQMSRVSQPVFPLSWSHYVFLMGIEDENERRFYEIESDNQNWSLGELRRQFNSALYERHALSGIRKRPGDTRQTFDLVKPVPQIHAFDGLQVETAEVGLESGPCEM